MTLTPAAFRSMFDTRRVPVDPTLPRPSWQQREHALESFLGRHIYVDPNELGQENGRPYYWLDPHSEDDPIHGSFATIEECRADITRENHADHLDYVRDECRREGWHR